MINEGRRRGGWKNRKSAFDGSIFRRKRKLSPFCLLSIRPPSNPLKSFASLGFFRSRVLPILLSRTMQRPVSISTSPRSFLILGTVRPLAECQGGNQTEDCRSLNDRRPLEPIEGHANGQKRLRKTKLYVSLLYSSLYLSPTSFCTSNPPPHAALICIHA